MNWYEVTRKEIVMAVVVLLAVGAVAFASYKLSTGRMGANWGFGPDWECSNFMGQSDLVCHKKKPQDAVPPAVVSN